MSRTTTAAPVGHTLSAPQRWLALSALVAATLMLAVDATVLFLAIPSLTHSMSVTGVQLLWISDVYSLAVAGLLMTTGSLADRLGRRRMLLAGATVFTIASALAAYSVNAEMLIAARVLLGAAGAMMMPAALALIRNIFTDATERTRAIAIWSVAFGAGSAIGPLVGGVLLEHFWWGSVFLINVPVMIAVIVVCVILLPESRDPNPGPFDLPSSVLSLLAMTPILWAIKHAATAGVDLATVVAAAIGIGAGIVFVRRQRRLAVPMIDVSLFRNPGFSGAVGANVIALFALTGLLLFFSQYLQLVRGYRPLVAGLAELPSTIASMVVVVFITIALRRLGLGRSIALGLILVTAGLAAIAAFVNVDSYLWLALALIPVGLGIGLAMTLTADAVVSAAPPAKAGAVSSITETAYELGVVLGVAVLGSLVNAVYRANLPAEALATVDPATVPQVEDSLASAMAVLPPDAPATAAAQDAFVGALQVGAVTAALFALVAAVVAWRVIPSPRQAAPARATH